MKTFSKIFHSIFSNIVTSIYMKDFKYIITVNYLCRFKFNVRNELSWRRLLLRYWIPSSLMHSCLSLNHGYIAFEVKYPVMMRSMVCNEIQHFSAVLKKIKLLLVICWQLNIIKLSFLMVLILIKVKSNAFQGGKMFYRFREAFNCFICNLDTPFNKS